MSDKLLRLESEDQVQLKELIRETLEEVLIKNDELEPEFDWHKLFEEPETEQGVLVKLLPYVQVVLLFVILLVVFWRT